HFVLELGRIPTAVAPRVVHRMGGQGWVGVVAAQVPGGPVPLKTLGKGEIIAAAGVGHVLAVNGACARGHTNLVRTTIITHHGAGGVCAVAVAVIGRGGIGSRSIPPVVVVVGAATVPTTILVDDGRVIPIQAGVIAGQDDALTIITH